MTTIGTSGTLAWRNRALFGAFFLSGFSGLLYQIVWLRLAFSRFGIITPVLSVVIALFMLGLGLGSWAGGNWIEAVSRRLRTSPLLAYAVVEALIGTWALLVPGLFDLGATALLQSGETSSFRYLFQSAIAITVAILPGCFLMGATFPLVTAYLHEWPDRDEHSFSFLYLANVIGAMSGAALTAMVVIELLGFRNTTFLGVGFNWLAALLSVLTFSRYPVPRVRGDAPSVTAYSASAGSGKLTILFLTGFVSMGMEVAWTRAFTPIVLTTIYAFAFLLTSYLLATWIGSYWYRLHLRRSEPVATTRLLWWVSLSAFLPLILNDPRLAPGPGHVFLSLFPICALLGYLTPKLVDEYSRGSARHVGFAYAVNIAGCILGPLAAGYWLLPMIGVRSTLLLLALPFVLLTWLFAARNGLGVRSALASTVLGLSTVLVIRTFEDANPQGPQFQVRRDHTATVISFGDGMDKRMLVNGVGITHLTPITKAMAHLPLLALPRAPESGLVVCFGMGTTFRSLLSWGIEATAVELVPSVRDAFGYYFADAPSIIRNPRATIVIDDGRRFLRRTTQRFDVITLDPPPPVEAAGSSLLYSREFYHEAKGRLRSDGVLQQWFPGGERRILEAVAAALAESFQHVRVFRSLESWGYHFLASDDSIRMPNTVEAIGRLPETAQRDLLEWYPRQDLASVLDRMLSAEIPLRTVLPERGRTALTDDRPYNEYFFLRRLSSGPLDQEHAR